MKVSWDSLGFVNFIQAWKKLSFYIKLKFSNPYIFATCDISNLDYLI